jgi:tetratricopeptide (TPR) repeat protein
VKLLIYRGESLERTLDLSDRDVRIGRGAENDVVLEDPEKTVSRFHAEMRPENGGWVLFDLNSQNGIWIDGQRIQRQVLNPGQTAQLGNFRIILDGGPNAVVAIPAAPAPEAMAATMVFSRDAAGAAVPAAPAAPAAAASAPAASGGPPPPPPPAPLGAAVTPKRPKLAPTGGESKKGLTSIPRPIFYGGALFFLLLIVLVMYVMRPRAPQPPPEPPQSQPQASTQTPATQPATPAQPDPSTQPATPAGNESNEQIVARYTKDAKDKLDANDPTAAIEAINRALMVDPGNAGALDLKMKAEERKAQLAGGTTTPSSGTPASGTPASGTPASGTPASGTTASGTAASGTAASGTPASGTPASGTPASGQTAGTTGTTAAADPTKPAVPDKAALAAARKEKAARDAAAALQKRYAQGKVEMTRGDYEHAIADLEAVVKEKPGYLDAASLLDQAKGLRRADAQRALNSANAAAGKGDYAAAMTAYQRAAKIDPNLAGVQDGMTNVRQKMRDEGEQAYRRARQLDAVGRTQDALPLYQRAVALLPADDPSGKAARDRLDALKGQNP